MKNMLTCCCRDRAQPRASQRSYNQEGTLIGTSPQLQSTRWVLWAQSLLLAPHQPLGSPACVA
ncbi:unnamed protein product [Gulo gulo]|uniref:Uncharacterized protein n=1 Tax=Gulo gulo TaxID=48420 RepID=A0A9X9LEG5_GULGU|nr:unnamed protein product [Gulo gulo]